MIKYIANEPSTGLIYVQKHTRDAVPDVISLSNRVSKKSREASLHAEDLEDSITMVRSMKEYGFPIVDEMIKDVANSLTLISATEQLKRELINGLDSSFSMRRTRSWGPKSWGYGYEDVQQDVTMYFSKIMKKASSIKWPQLDSKEPIETEPQEVVQCPAPPVAVASASTGSILDIVSRFKLPQLESKGSIETEPQKPVVSACTSQLTDKLHEEEEEKVETDDNVELSDPSSLLVSKN